MSGDVEALVWSVIVATMLTFFSWRAYRALGTVRWRAARTPYDAYMHGQLLLGPLSWTFLLIALVRALG